jgi:uncharacterized membrane protein YkoI
MSVQTSTESGRVRGRAAWLAVLPVMALTWPSVSPAAARGSADIAIAPVAARTLADRQISMDEAVDLAQRRYNARVVRAEVSERGGRRVYLLRLLSSDGRVFNVSVDAATGSIQ